MNSENEKDFVDLDDMWRRFKRLFGIKSEPLEQSQYTPLRDSKSDISFENSSQSDSAVASGIASPNCDIESTRRTAPSRFLDSLTSFEGRIARTGFLLVIVGVHALNYLIVSILDFLLGSGQYIGILGVMLAFTVWIIVAAAVKRWHDQAISGWYALLLLVPFANLFVLLVLLASPGTYGENQYGPPPKV